MNKNWNNRINKKNLQTTKQTTTQPSFFNKQDASESCWGFSSVMRCNLYWTSRSKPEAVLKPCLQCGFLHLHLLLVTAWSLLVSFDTSIFASAVLFLLDVLEGWLIGTAWFFASTCWSSDRQSTSGSVAASASSSDKLVTGCNEHCSSCIKKQKENCCHLTW